MNTRNHYSDGTVPTPGDRVLHYMDSDIGTVLSIASDGAVTVRWDDDGIIVHFGDELTPAAS